MESLVYAAIGVLTGEAFARSHEPESMERINRARFDEFNRRVLHSQGLQPIPPTPSAPSKPQEHGR